MCPGFFKELHAEREGLDLFAVVGFNPVSISTFYFQLFIPDGYPVDVFGDPWHTEQDDFTVGVCEPEGIVYCDTGSDTIKGNIYTAYEYLFSPFGLMRFGACEITECCVSTVIRRYYFICTEVKCQLLLVRIFGEAEDSVLIAEHPQCCDGEEPNRAAAYDTDGVCRVVC